MPVRKKKAKEEQEGPSMSPPQAERPVSSEEKERAIADRAERGPSLLTSAALIGIGALIEPELLAGMAIGAGIVFASKWIPDLVGGVLRPVVKTAVKAGYAAAEVVSEATEQVQDMVAEVRADHEREAAHPQA
jgi:hypothetical protein